MHADIFWQIKTVKKKMAVKDITTQNPESAPNKILILQRKGLFMVKNYLNSVKATFRSLASSPKNNKTKQSSITLGATR